jgi:hypothetical protein
VITDWAWRWVLFVDAPVGAALLVAAPLPLRVTERRRGRSTSPA